FKGAARDYAADPKLAREARRQLRQFKALFDSFSARNFGRNAEGGESNGSYRASMNIGDEKVNVTLDEDKDLVAIHNLTEKNLLDTLELGGFPMPSIAIIRKGQEHSKYGDISVIFGRETIDNVIRVMREQIETGGQTIFSGNSIWGVAAKEYNSIDEVKADKERLKKLPEEEYKAMAEELGGRLEKIAQSIKSDSESNVFIAVDDAMSLIVDCVRECKTKASMLAYLKRYNKKATVKTVDDIVDLVRDIANMPTGYFEAKPRRAVDFSEIKMVELPDGASDTLKAKLDENNIPYEVYGNTDQQRAEKIDKLKNVRFAMNANIEAEIDDVLSNKFHKDHVKLTENTPGILLSQKGVRDLPLYMKPSHVRENIFTEAEAKAKGYKTGDKINYHGLGKTKFIEVISDLDNVVEAYRGTKNAEKPERREKYFLLISKIKDSAGEVINVPVYINEYADYHNVMVDTNKVATVYGKEGLRSYLQREIQKGNLVRIKKKSLQVGDAAAPIAAPYALKASDNSILNPEEKVNTSGENSSKKSENSAKRASMDASYLSAVERGDMETAQRMVDEAAKEAGYDKLFYHGAKKGGGFNTFRDWSYFTENKQYAERYTDRDKPGSLYTVYAKLQKPFDTRNAEARKEFKAIRQEYGLSDIQASGLPDWTDGYDIADYIDENDLDYDSILLDEGGDLVNGKPISRGISYVIRKSAQVKSANPVTYDDNGNVIPLSERFNSKKSDIRYSMEPTATESEAKAELPRKAERANMTVGQLKKHLANYSRAKTYSRKEALSIVSKIDAGKALSESTRNDIANEKGERLGDGVSKIY
ncbi:MAG: hypothetical protein IKV16_05350, partial [Clostridia bacterium]|nr:hypothetical protein [Clostridia bacterium]